jgi:hypothetical protein
MHCRHSLTVNELFLFSKFVLQKCVGPRVPASTLTLGESTVFCDSNTVDVVVRHVVTLGALCEGLPHYFSGDLLFECTERNDNFEILIDAFGTQGERFACYEFVTLTTGSIQNSTKLVPAVAISTDANWLAGGGGNCFDQARLNAPSTGMSPPSTPTAPTNPPVAPQPVGSAPITPQPVAPQPTATEATKAPIVGPTYLDLPPSTTTSKPASAPTPVQVAPVKPVAPVPVDLSSGDGGNSGAVVGSVIGGIGAGIAIMAVIGFFWLRKKQTQTRPKGHMAEIPSKTFSVKGSSRFLDDAQYTESTGESDNLPPPSFCQPAMSAPSIVRPTPTPTNYEVAYKDQSRSVIEPVLPPLALSADGEHLPMVAEEHIPFAVAVSTALPSGNHVEWAQAEPLRPSQEGLFHI